MHTPSGNGVEGSPLSTDARPDRFHPSISGLEPNSALDYNGQTGGHFDQLDFNQFSFDQFCSDQIDQAEQGQMTPLTAFLMSDLDQFKAVKNTLEAVIYDGFWNGFWSIFCAFELIRVGYQERREGGHLSRPVYQGRAVDKGNDLLCNFLILLAEDVRVDVDAKLFLHPFGYDFVGNIYKVVAKRIQEKFSIYVRPKILSKQYKKIAEQESKVAILYKAIVNATRRIKSVLEDELDKICAGDASKLVKEKQDMNRQLPDLLQSLRAVLWRQSQAQARGA